MRSLVKVVMEGAGHRVIGAGGFQQAQLLLSNGLVPDLLLVESTPEHAADTARLCELLNCAPMQNVCLILGIGDQALREKASELGIKHLLTKPVTRYDLESVIDGLNRPVEQESGLGVSHSAER